MQTKNEELGSDPFHESAIPPGGLTRPGAGTSVLQTADVDWTESGAKGFWIKSLFEDERSGQRTWLMKVEAGCEAPPHAHEDFEQIYVLEGRFHDGANTYGPGDFVVRAPGAIHTGGSKDGGLVLLIYSK